MRGTLKLAKAEVNRLRRNRRYFIFTLLFPVVLYLAIGKQHGRHLWRQLQSARRDDGSGGFHERHAVDCIAV